MKRVFAVVLHYKGKQLTEKCLRSLLEQKGRGFKLGIVLVDNASPEPVNRSAVFKSVHWLKSDRNLGFAGGNNLGIKYALNRQADFVFVVNNDTVCDDNLITNLLKAAQKEPNGGIFSPKIYFAKGHEYHKNRYQEKDLGNVIWYAGGKIDWANIFTPHRGVNEVDHGQYNKTVPTGFISGCGMFVKARVFEKVGLFDEKYFLYLEDADFCQRVKRAGFELIFASQAKLWHFNAGSSEKVGSNLHDYFLARNRLLFGFRYAPFRTKLALVRESFKLLLIGRPWQKKGVADFYLHRFGQGSWG